MRFLILFAALLSAVHAQSPGRIVSTSPSVTETLYALGLGPQVAGVTSFCDYPPEAARKPKIGTFLQPDYERILSLRPTLVLVIKNPVGVASKLEGLGLKTEELDMDRVGSILASIQLIGRATGSTSAANQLVSRLKTSLDRVRKAASGRSRPSVLFIVGRAPGTLQNMVGAGPGTFLDELLRLAGGVNILEHSPIQYPKVSLEQVFAADPDVIIDMGDYAHSGSDTGERRRLEELALWSPYKSLRAVRTGRVHAVTDSFFVVPGPRMDLAAAAFLKFLHPGARP